MKRAENTPRNTDRLRLIVMSDLLKAEIAGKPVEFARYCAKHPNRKTKLDELNSGRLLQHFGNNNVGLTFGGLVLATTPTRQRF